MAKSFLFLLVILLVACSGLGPPPIVVPQPPQPLVGGLTTHFDGPIDPAILAELKARNWQVARADVQRLDTQTARAVIQQIVEAGLRPLIIVRDAGQMLQLPDGLDYELRNEPDLEGPKPQVYRGLMNDIARYRENRTIWVGVVSNFNERGFDYLRALKPFPENVGISIHNYGDGQFAPTEAKYAHFIDIIGQRPYIITEFGYPTSDISEEDSARLLKQEFDWWATHGARFSLMYQLNDGPDKDKESYGIRRFDGTWKPSADILRGQ